MSSIYKYRLYCIEEDAYVLQWAKTPPTICPNDHADKSINTNITSIVDTINVNHFKAEENTEGDFETSHVTMEIPSGTPGDVTEHDVSWPSDILLWKTLLNPTTEMIGDEISVLGGPETIIGVITSPVIIGDTILNVNSTVTDNAKRGYLLTLDDTVNKDVLGRISAIDPVGGTITVENPTTFAYNPGTPVKISVYILRNIYIANTNVLDIGGKGFKGKTVTSGTILRVYYTNNSGTAKIFRWRPEYYNDG